jgi:flagellar biosynthesis anti-sigma factor FlgM
MAINPIHDITSIVHSDKTDKAKSPQNGKGQILPSSSVSLEEAAAITAEAKRLAQKEPTIDEVKVKAVRDAILSGQYYIDSIKVARKLLGYE